MYYFAFCRLINKLILLISKGFCFYFFFLMAPMYGSIILPTFSPINQHLFLTNLTDEKVCVVSICISLTIIKGDLF